MGRTEGREGRLSVDLKKCVVECVCVLLLRTKTYCSRL